MFKNLKEYKEFIPGKTGVHTWKSPSNIALIKYWGKKGEQQPENPNLSFSLKNSVSITKITYTVRSEAGLKYNFLFHGTEKESFKSKINAFFDKIKQYLPFIDFLEMKIESENTFPHSAGIASSASAMSALSLALMSIYSDLSGEDLIKEDFLMKASFLSRLGSGSACRSVFPSFSMWGKNEIVSAASDNYAIPLKLKEDSFFHGLKDSILIVDSGEKSLSSTGGHGLMEKHPFAASRYKQARLNFNQLVYAINTENIDLFVEIIENEALSLHALMMSSVPGTILLKPGTLSIIESIIKFRMETQKFIAFTIDAGPNIHLISHERDEKIITDFINSNLKKFCHKGNVIYDMVGNGPEKM